MRRITAAIFLVLVFWSMPRVEAIVKNPTGYTLQFHSSTLAAPVDATTYYSGGLFALPPQPATPVIQAVMFPKAGVVRAAYLHIMNFGTAGSNETSTASLRFNNSTDVTITAAVVSSASTVYSNTALSTTVAAGTYFELKWVTPTWATNPTNLVVYGSVFVEVP